MAVCARAVLQGDGSYLLGLEPAITDLSTCAYVVETGSDSVIGSLMNLSPENALTISFAVAVLWASAWGIKQVIRVMNGASNVDETY